MSRHWCLAAAGVLSLTGAVAAPSLAVAPRGGQVVSLRQVAAAYAACVVRVAAPVARGVVLQNFTNAQINRDPVARRLFDEGCMSPPASDNAIGPQSPGGMRFSGDLFRYSLADALIQKDYADRRHFDFTTVPPLQHFTPAPLISALANGTDSKARRAQETYASLMGLSAFSKFGECVSRRDPDGVQKLILTHVLSDAENAAFAALSPALGQCLVSGQLRLSREVVRGLVALNFYRLAGAPAGANVTTLKGTR